MKSAIAVCIGEELPDKQAPEVMSSHSKVFQMPRNMALEHFFRELHAFLRAFLAQTELTKSTFGVQWDWKTDVAVWTGVIYGGAPSL